METEHELTGRQEEYLLILTSFGSAGCRLTDLADRLDVRMPTALHVIDLLEEYGYVSRSESDRMIRLTPAGKEYISEKLGKLYELAHWLEEHAALSPYEAVFEARTMVVSLRPDTIAAILGRDPAEEAKQAVSIPDGLYSIGVTLNKKGSYAPSHGDKGLQKPALLFRRDDDCELFIQTKGLDRRRGSAMLTGRLQRMWYMKDGSWTEAESDENGLFRIPYEELRVINHAGRQIGIVRVKVRVSVGGFNMPDSEADLQFDLGSIEEIS